MAKRPTPKKRREKSRGGTQQSAYEAWQVKRLTARQQSPYAAIAEPKNKAGKALKGITKIKA
ncbi:hypothetical protein KJ652_02550 [Patescibacteria group bacterium]|nr:hypothetical protein [Patescibacteria group bacterium]